MTNQEYQILSDKIRDIRDIFLVRCQEFQEMLQEFESAEADQHDCHASPDDGCNHPSHQQLDSDPNKDE